MMNGHIEFYVGMITSSRKGIASGGSNSGLYVVMQRARQIGTMPAFGSPSAFSFSSSYTITNLVEKNDYGVSAIFFASFSLSFLSVFFFANYKGRICPNYEKNQEKYR